MINFKRDSDNLIVAGNGPNIANINTDELPDNFDVFRCNHFYKENIYYLGNKIKLLSCSVSVYYSMLDTLNYILKNNDYQIDNIMFDGFIRSGHTKLQKHNFNKKLLHEYDFFHNNQKSYIFYQMIKEKITSNNIYPNTGILSILHGALLGYKNIYITGIDFYESNKYVYELEANSNLRRFSHSDNPKDRNNNIKHGHTQEANYKLLDIIHKEFKDINFYSLNKKDILGTTPPSINSKEKELFLKSISYKQEKSTTCIKDLICNTKDFYNTKNPFKLLERKIRHFFKDKKIKQNS